MTLAHVNLGDPGFVYSTSVAFEEPERTDERAVGQTSHLPGPETVSTWALLDLPAAELGYPVGVRNVPKLVMRAIGLVNPLMRELAEMAYEFEEPFVLDLRGIHRAHVPGSSNQPFPIGRGEPLSVFRLGC